MKNENFHSVDEGISKKQNHQIDLFDEVNKSPDMKYIDWGKIVKQTKDKEFVATYKNCYTAGHRNNKKPRRIFRNIIGRSNSTGGYIYMTQEEYHNR